MQRQNPLSFITHSAFGMTPENQNSFASQTPQFTVNADNSRINELRSDISDLAVVIDAHKAKIARGVGGGVFLFALAALATYDLLTGKSGLWLSIGVAQEALLLVAIGLSILSLSAFAYALLVDKRRDLAVEARMKELEDELDDLLNRKHP